MDKLQKLYDLLSREGKYTKSFEEFRTQWQDPEYQDKVYSVVSRDGFYTKDKDSFLQQYPSDGVESAKSATKAPLKKKEPTNMGLPLGVSSSESPTQPQSDLNPFTKNMVGIPQDAPKQQQQPGVTVETMTPESTQQLSEIIQNTPQSEGVLPSLDKTTQTAIAESTPDKFQKEMGRKALSSITPEFIGLKEENVVPEMNYRFGDLGFKFKQSGATGDWMTVTAPNGNTTEISLDPITGSKEKEESDRLKAFISQNTVGDKPLDLLESDKLDKYKKIKDEKELDATLSNFSKKTSNFGKETDIFLKNKLVLDKKVERLSNIPESQRNTEEYLAEQELVKSQFLELDSQRKILLTKMSNIKSEQKQINSVVGKYMDMKGEQGDFAGWSKNLLSEGLTSVAKGIDYMVIDAMDIMNPLRTTAPDVVDLQNKVRKQFIDLEFQRTPDVFKDEGTTVEYSDLASEGFWGTTYAGVMHSAPAMALAMLNPAMGGKIAFTAQGYAAGKEEMDKIPAFKNISEQEKSLYLLPLGVINAVLEETGLRNVIESKGLLNGLVLKVLGKAGATTTATTFRELVNEEVTNMLAKGVLTLGAAGLAEAETGATQQIAEITAKQVYNTIKQKRDEDGNYMKMFATPESIKEYAEQVAIAGAQEMVGGFMMGAPTAVGVAFEKHGFLGLENKDLNAFELYAKHPFLLQAYETKRKNDVAEGKITQEEMDKNMDYVRNSMALITQLPEGLNNEQKKKAMNSLQKKKELEKQIEGKDKALVAPQIEQIKKIDEALIKIGEEAAKVKAEAEQKAREASISESTKLLEGENTQAIQALIPDVMNSEKDSGKSAEQIIAEQYQQASQNNSNPEFVKAVDELLNPKRAINEEVSRLEAMVNDEVDGMPIKPATANAGLDVTTDGPLSDLASRQKDKRIVKIFDNLKNEIKTARASLPNFKIVVHEDEGSYNAAMKEVNGTEGTNGNISYTKLADGTYEGSIDINLERADGTTASHEITHGILLTTFGDNPELFKEFKEKLGTVLNETSNKALIDFSNQYEGEGKHEEYLTQLVSHLRTNIAQISPSTLQKIAKVINEIVSKVTNGQFTPFQNTAEFVKNATEEDVRDVVEFFNSIATSMKKGEAIDESLVNVMKEGVSFNIGEPTTIERNKSQKNDIVKVGKTPYPLSFVTEKDIIDIDALINEIIEKNQKVWFWMADQLGRGNYYDSVIDGEHYLDAGPSFALDPENLKNGILWASGLAIKTLQAQIEKCDYIFFISGSPEKAKLFNKRVLDLTAQRINKKANFNKFKNAINKFGKETNELKDIKEALSDVNSFEELANSSKRKPFLIAIDKISSKKTPLKELLGKFNAFVDYNELRDGFFKENGFVQNDIMLVGKPTSVGGKAIHSTYENSILGEVVGVPDKRVDSWDIMPNELKEKYKNVFSGREEKTKSLQAKVIAAEIGVVRELKSKSQVAENKSKAIEIARKMGMNDKGFFDKNSNPSQLNNMLRQYEHSVKKAATTGEGFGGGYFLVDNKGKKVNITTISKSQVATKSDNFFDKIDEVFPNDHLGGGYAATDANGNLLGRIKMTQVDDNTVKIDEIVSKNKGERTGNGSKIMNIVTKVADENNVKMILTPNLIGEMKAKGFETPQKLKEFYSKFGFEKSTKNNMMERNPVASKSQVSIEGKYEEIKDTFFGGLNANKNRLFFTDLSSVAEMRGDSRADVAMMFDGATFWLSESNDGYVTIDDFQVNLDKLGQGKGSESLKTLTEFADKNNITLIGEPLAQSERRAGTKKGLNQKQLNEFYKKNGFTKISKDTLNKNRAAENNFFERVPVVSEKVQSEVDKMNEEFPISKSQKGLINLSENDVIKYKKIGVEDKRIAQAMNQIGLSGVKFTKEEIEAKIKEEFEWLVANRSTYLISKDSRAITNAINNDIAALEERGAPSSVIKYAESALDENSPRRQEYIDSYAKAQKEAIGRWVDFLMNSNYDNAFKYLIFDAVLTHNYEAITNSYKKRTDTTIRNITPFDEGTLAAIYNSDSKALLKDYIDEQIKNIGNIVEYHSFKETKEGVWLKFDGMETPELDENANKLSQLVQNTYWCTKENALQQLSDGDFYVFVTKDDNGIYNPRIAVRMEGDNVGEVRGNESEKQDIEADMLPIADKFLTESIPNDSGKKWLESIEFNSKAKSFVDELKAEPYLTTEYFEKFIEFKEVEKKYSEDYGRNGFLEKAEDVIKEKIEKGKISDELVGKIAYQGWKINDKTIYFVGNLFELKDDRVSTYFEQAPNLEVLIGNFDQEDLSEIKSFGNLKRVTGNFDITNCSVESLGKLEFIGGDLKARGALIQSFGELKVIGGNANLNRSEIESLDNLMFIGGHLHLEYAIIKSLGNLKKVNGNFVAYEMAGLKSFGNLEEVGGNLDIPNIDIESLGKLKFIGGDANFRRSTIKSLGNLEFINGNAYFNDSEIKSLEKIKQILGKLNISNSKLTSLGDLTHIGEDFYISNSRLESLGKLKTIDGDFKFFGDCPFLYSLKGLESVGGDVYISGDDNLESLGDLKFIGGHLQLNAKNINSLGKLESINGNIDLFNDIDDIGNLKSIGGSVMFFGKNTEIQDKLMAIAEGGSAFKDGGRFDSKSQLNDNTKVAKVVKDARAQGFSEDAIRVFLERKGFDSAQIDAAMNPKTPAAGRVTLSEELTPGYDRMIGEVQGIIEKSTKRGVSKDKMVDNVMQYVMGSKVYQNATDVQREKIVRDIEKQFGIRQKSAPLVTRLLNSIKDVKTITLSEKELLAKQIQDEARGAKNAKIASSKVSASLVKYLKELRRKGDVSTNQVGAILRRFSNVNLFDEKSISKFVDYMSKVFKDAEYADKIKNIRKALPTAKKNIKNKIGIAENLYPILNRLFSINPNLIPESMFNDYLSLVEMFGKKDAVLSLAEISSVTNSATEILNSIDDELSAVEELSQRLEEYDNKVTDDDGKLNYAETLSQMLADDVITNEEYNLMRKYKSEIMPSEGRVALTEEELAEEKKSLIDSIKGESINAEELPTSDEIKLANKIKELIKTNALEGLTNQELNNLFKVINNINNGYLPHYAQLLVEKMNSINNSAVLGNSISNSNLALFSKFYATLKSMFTKKGAIDEMVRRNPLFYIDQVFKDFKTKGIYNSIFNAAAEGQSKFASEFKRVQEILEDVENKILNSFGKDLDKTLMSKFKMMTYMIQLEYESNEGSKQVNPASDYLKKTIAHIEDGLSSFGQKDADKLQKILNDYAPSGEIDSKKIYDSFNKQEKEAINAIRKVNESLSEKAMYTAAIIRGERINPLTNYMHLNVLHEYDPSDVTETPSFVSEYNNSLRPSTKAKSLIERTGKVSPLNFDIFSAAMRSSKFVLMDYHLTEPIRTARKTLNEASKIVSKDKREVLNAIKNAFEEATTNLLSNTFTSTSALEDAMNYASKQGYRAILASSTRFVSELTSNLGFAVIVDPVAFKTGIQYASVIMSADAPLIMDNVNSKETNRIMHGDTLSGKMVDINLLNRASGSRNSKSKGYIANKLYTIFNQTVKRPLNYVEITADALISTPDKIVMRPIWFGSFAVEFKKQSGVDVDFDKIAKNDKEYMTTHKDAIEKAKIISDEKSVRAGASENAFNGILKGTIKPNQSAMLRAFNSANNFMTRFLIYEYISARTGVMAAMGNGSLNRRQGVALLSGVTTRMLVYTLMSKMLSQGLVSIFRGDDDDEEDKKTFTQEFGQAFASAISSMLITRDFGNITKTVLNYGIEKGNEKYLDFLRNGEYDPYKDAIQFSQIPVEPKKGGMNLTDVMLNMTGSYSPMFKTANLIAKKYTEGPKKEEDAIKRREDEINIRIPLEILGSAGLIPLYKDVRRVILDNMYKSLRTKQPKSDYKEKLEENRQQKQEALLNIADKTTDEDVKNAAYEKMSELNSTDETKKANKEEAAAKSELLFDTDTGEEYDNETEMKRYNRPLWEQNFGPESDWYREHEAEKKIEQLMNKEVRAIEDKEYGYTAPEKKKSTSKKNSDGTIKRSYGSSYKRRTFR